MSTYYAPRLSELDRLAKLVENLRNLASTISQIFKVKITIIVDEGIDGCSTSCHTSPFWKGAEDD